MSGTTRPSMLPGLSDLTRTFCQAGLSNFMLTPPPVEPPPSFSVRWPGASHQVTSFTDAPDCSNMVPPMPSANGLELGKSTWALPSSSWSPDPSSPEETQIVIPSKRAAFKRSLIASIAPLDQPLSSSANPQLTDSTAGLSAITLLSRFTQPPWSNDEK